MASNNPARVSLGTFLQLRKEFFIINDAVEYQLVTVQLHARGIKERERLLGSQIKTKRQQKIKAGDLLVAEIDAKVGGFGIVPADLDGAIVSSHYFLYEADTSQIDSTFLEYYLKSGQPEQDVKQFVKGALNYAAIRPRHFPQLEIPLPPLPEQRRIVERIDALATRIAEAQGLQAQAVEEAEAISRSLLDQIYVRLAKSFGTTDLKDACVTITDGNHITPKFSDSGVRFIFVGNVSSGHLHFENCKYVPTEYYEALRCQRQPEVGDVLYTAVGATLGIPAVVDKSDKFCFQRHVAILKR